MSEDIDKKIASIVRKELKNENYDDDCWLKAFTAPLDIFNSPLPLTLPAKLICELKNKTNNKIYEFFFILTGYKFL